jgi:hypothetical protein
VILSLIVLLLFVGLLVHGRIRREFRALSRYEQRARTRDDAAAAAKPRSGER